MAKLILSIVIAVSSSISLADTWKPWGFENYSRDERKIIYRLDTLTNINKSLVHMLFEGARFSNCDVKAHMTPNGVVVSLAHFDSKRAFGISVDTNNALFSDIFFRSKNHATYILVSEQKVVTPDPNVESLTYLMYFDVNFDGTIRELKIFSRINKIKKPLLPMLGRSERYFDIGPHAVCR